MIEALLILTALMIAALFPKLRSQRSPITGKVHVTPILSFLLSAGMAYGFGTARGVGDILHSPEHDFHLGVWKADTAPGELRTSRLVTRTAAGKVKVAGDEAINVLGFCRKRVKEATTGDRNPTFDRSTSFLVNDEIEVASPKPGALVEAILATTDNGTAGQFVVPAANGKVKLYAPDVTATVNETTVEAALAENASIVAMLMEDCDASAADKACLLKWLR